jgi:hypothetical protein
MSARALIPPSGPPPEELPTAVGELGEWREVTVPQAAVPPLTLFLTVDTEDAYFTRPHLMTGEGIGREHGVFAMLDELEARALRATFFVNVYEADRQPPGAVEAVVREIGTRGHEVGLHTHPSPALDFYRRPLFRLDPAAQRDVILWGAERIERWTGLPPISFRAGGYALNEDTYPALAEAGIEVDSSWFFPSPNNHLTRTAVNAVTAHAGLVEMPVTTVLRTRDERLEHRKVDLDWLSVGQLTEALDSLLANGAGFGMFMMHSFSFIEKATRMPEDEPSPRAIYTSEPLFNRYVEIYGPKAAMRASFADFLERVDANPALEVRTLGEAVPQLREQAERGSPDVIPIVSG